MPRSKPRRKKGKQAVPIVHDRTAMQVPAHTVARVIIVDNPYEAGDKIKVVQSLRDDPLGRMYCRGQVDEAQYRAGRDMQGFYERAEVGNIKAMDTTKEPVDGRGIPEPLTDKQMYASDMVVELEDSLGKDGAAIIRDFLAQRLFVEQIAAKRGMTAEREIRYFARRVRECLERLAKELNYA